MPRRNRGPRLVFRKDRGFWYVRWYKRGRARWESTGTADSAEAQGQLSTFIRRRAGHQRPRDPAAFPIIDALEDYSEEHAGKTLAPERISYAIDALGTFWGDLCVGDVTDATCAAYGRARSVSDGTLRRELGVLRAAINHEVRHGRLIRPVHVWLPPKPEPRDRWLTRREAAALLRAARRDRRCRLHLPLFILIGLYTGARKQAILSLRWPQVDLDRGRIDFNPPGRVRTSKRRPIIPVPRRLLWFLRQARARGTEIGYVVNRKGKRVGDVQRAFATAAVRAGLCEAVTDAAGKPVMRSDGQPLRRATVSPHTLRHTSGTWMAQAGVDLWQIAGYLGHSHERTTELYSHHHPDYLAKAREALD